MYFSPKIVRPSKIFGKFRFKKRKNIKIFLGGIPNPTIPSRVICRYIVICMAIP
jgi:hypothetical protein